MSCVCVSLASTAQLSACKTNFRRVGQIKAHQSIKMFGKIHQLLDAGRPQEAEWKWRCPAAVSRQQRASHADSCFSQSTETAPRDSLFPFKQTAAVSALRGLTHR